jgi:alanyl-tRNA synthetase
MKLEQIRQQFLDYFQASGHSVMRSSSLVPNNDPTLMFTAAGMVQFKNIFTGKEVTPTPPRAATAQKCVRAGGKHNDLDNVGYTARHHTFFEMMGNFSFADYFKEEAIYYAWNFLTRELGLPAEKLYATVYHTDDEAFGLWKKIAGLPDEKIMRIPTSDNFWAMGDTGPCGPCSEIFYDHGADAAEGKWALDANGNDQFGDRFIEIWNLVFMQYEQVSVDERILLPKPSIDTGMGLERMAAVMQGKHDNYDIDIFAEIRKAIRENYTEKISHIPEGRHYIASSEKTFNNPQMAITEKVIADHLRSMSFLIADGVSPSNEGRGYVLRRIMRRAMRYVYMYLGQNEPFIYKLVPILVQQMGGAYPELKMAEPLIVHTIKSEEERFMATIGRGLHYLHKQTEHLSKGDKLQGEVAFKLYDTYGFPLDLTQDILPKDISVDLAGFNAAMLQQKERARAAWKGSGVNAVADVWLALRDEYGATEFLGYNQTKIAANLLAIIKDGKVVEYAATGDVVDLIFNQTVAYGESGGQSGDSGEIFNDDGKLIGVIQDVKKNADLHIHHVALLQKFTVGENVVIAYDNDKRQAVKANHSATHLLHAALREHLGEHVTQKGSLVTNERLRFDFSHNNALSSTELQHIEQRVNEVIWQNAPVQTKLMSADAAIKAGAMALFGEKYSDEVRVLSMGDGYSVELCGGTHVDRTGDIGAFKIVSEQAIAAGVRRIEAVTRAGALQVAQQNEAVLKKMAGMLTSPVEELPNKVAGLLEERKELQQNLANAKKNMALQGGGSSEEQLGDVNFISRNLQGLEAKELRGVAMELLKGRTQAIVAVASEYEGKGAILVAITPDLTSNYDAVKLVQLAVAVLGGKGGGGKADMAQGGGADGSKCAGAINAIKENINGTVSKNL